MSQTAVVTGVAVVVDLLVYALPKLVARGFGHDLLVLGCGGCE